MRLIDRFRGSEVREQATAWGDWGEKSGPGAPVTVNNSLQVLTVYGCVRLIADSIATLPLDVFRRAGDEKIPLPTPGWLEQPTVDLDRTAWLTQILTSLLLAGNAYLWMDLSTSGGVNQAIPLDPGQVQVRREKGRKQYWVNGTEQPAFRIRHIPAVMFPGADVGLSPVEAARQSIGLSRSVSDAGARFFTDGMNMPGVIENPNDYNQTQATEMARAWARARRSNAGLPGMLYGGATWKATGITQEQAQFLESRRYSAAEIAGQMFLIDPSELGIGVEGTSLTYANLEQRKVRLASVTLQPWIVRLEHAISAALAAPRYVKFNMAAFLRGDTLSRYQAHAIGIDKGFVLKSEARKFEDFPPIDGIDDMPAPVGGSDAPAF
jgi:HK97 family phage portal protein